MKKFLKNLLFVMLISFFVGYIYVNKDKVEDMAMAVNIYAKSITLSESQYNDEFKINDIKLNVNNYYYEKLNENQKSIYKSLANGIKELKNEIILKEYKYVDNQTSLSDIEMVFNYFCLDHPEVFYLNNSYTVSNMSSIIGDKVIIEVSYSVQNIEELSNKVEQINEVIESYLVEAKGKSQIDSEIIFHDSIARDVKYYKYTEMESVPNSCHTIEGAFLNGEAVCDGLSKAMQVLLSNIDINNIIVLGEIENGPHAWNMLELDGYWYNLDITSDKSIKLENTDNIIIHTYFNVSNDYIESTHTFSQKDILPISENIDNKYNYYVYMKKYISDSDNFRNKLSEIVLNNTDENILEFCVENKKDVSSDFYSIILSTGKMEYLSEKKVYYYNILNSYIIIKK